MTASELQEKAAKVATKAAAAASAHDREATFPQEALEALRHEGFLGLLVPATHGGMGLGIREASEVLRVLAAADASAAMVYLMHLCGTACIAAAPSGETLDAVLRDIAAGKHLTTLAFSEAGSRSHFWAPVSKAAVRDDGLVVNARKSWVTSASHADSFVVSTGSAAGSGPTESVLLLVKRGQPGIRVDRPFDGLGLRANDSAPMTLEDCVVGEAGRLTADGKGMDAMLGVVLPLFSLGSASVSTGIARATVVTTAGHLKSARFDHLGASLGEALPTLRARLAEMHLAVATLEAHLETAITEVTSGAPSAQLRVLEAKAIAGDTAVRVAQMAIHTCGGAAFSKHLAVERHFRDAHAGIVMAPTSDVLKEFIGKALLDLPLF